ncbi:hypothetical protein G9A89_019906 [Geosiphon pyriformis]|nr:hypothetical protein G9A89_019906 [Geosiphon pyriformis]
MSPSVPPPPPSVLSFSTVGELSVALTDLIVKLSSESIAARGRFTIGLSGGSLPKLLAANLKSKGQEVIAWDQWRVFFCDERLVPLDHEDSNYKLWKQELFSKVLIPDEQIYAINEELIDNAEEAAEDYKDKLIEVFAAMNTAKFPVFDLLLLGMGPDGHTCSLFPGHPALDETTDWVVAVEDSPKPPPRRITFTLPVVNHAHHVAFVVTGEGKQDMMKKVVELKQQEYPSARVQPAHGKLYWFLDDAASAQLSSVEK